MQALIEVLLQLLQDIVYFNNIGGVLSFGALTCGTNRGWCNSDNTLIQSIPSSASSTECGAMAHIYTWSMPALTMAMTWMCIVWCLTTWSVRIVNMDNPNSRQAANIRQQPVSFNLGSRVGGCDSHCHVLSLLSSQGVKEKKQVSLTAGHTWEHVLSWRLSQIRPSSPCSLHCLRHRL